jgi:hypothetical protein
LKVRKQKENREREKERERERERNSKQEVKDKMYPLKSHFSRVSYFPNLAF